MGLFKTEYNAFLLKSEIEVRNFYSNIRKNKNMIPLLEVKGLKTYFYTDDGVIPAVDGIDFVLEERETIGIVGESGCGKSVTLLSIMRLISTPPGRIIAGQILLKGQDLLQKTEKEMCSIRGNDIAMIFQEPMTSLNPVLTIGTQIIEAIIIHQKLHKKQARCKAIEMLKSVSIPSPKLCLKEYPHQLSGGMRQRVMIAMALSCQPQLLIADELTTALDVTIQDQVLDLLNNIRNEMNMPIIMITHNMGIIAELAEEVIVMYCGRIVERTDVNSLFEQPLHPYTQGLMNSIPKIYDDIDRLYAIKGMVPNPAEMPIACRFHPRCNIAEEHCYMEAPMLKEVKKGHYVACWIVQEGKEPCIR